MLVSNKAFRLDPTYRGTICMKRKKKIVVILFTWKYVGEFF